MRARSLVITLVSVFSIALVGSLAGTGGAGEPVRQDLHKVVGGKDASPQKVFIGGAVLKVTYACQISENEATETSSATWKDIPGAAHVVPESGENRGLYRFIRATFTAQSACAGGPGKCAIRIVAKHPSSSTLYYFAPYSAAYAFDSNPGGATRDDVESHALTRSILVSNTWQGNVVVKVQYRVARSATTQPVFVLDDWALDITENV